jgi:AsmA protein
VPTRDLDLKGVAALVSNASASADEFDLPFVVQGPWDDPIILPDAQALIRRSGAAAPLLDAAKTYNASDAVRSVIDQLLAAPSPAAPATASGTSSVSAPNPPKSAR